MKRLSIPALAVIVIGAGIHLYRSLQMLPGLRVFGYPSTVSIFGRTPEPTGKELFVYYSNKILKEGKARIPTGEDFHDWFEKADSSGRLLLRDFLVKNPRLCVSCLAWFPDKESVAGVIRSMGSFTEDYEYYRHILREFPAELIKLGLADMVTQGNAPAAAYEEIGRRNLGDLRFQLKIGLKSEDWRIRFHALNALRRIDGRSDFSANVKTRNLFHGFLTDSSLSDADRADLLSEICRVKIEDKYGNPADFWNKPPNDRKPMPNQNQFGDIKNILGIENGGEFGPPECNVYDLVDFDKNGMKELLVGCQGYEDQHFVVLHKNSKGKYISIFRGFDGDA